MSDTNLSLDNEHDMSEKKNDIYTKLDIDELYLIKSGDPDELPIRISGHVIGLIGFLTNVLEQYWKQMT
jgi:hypothetical protein